MYLTEVKSFTVICARQSDYDLEDLIFYVVTD